MADMQRRLADWRRTMAETAGCRPEVIDELEGHLREEMQRLLLAGETEDRAFDVALFRLGTPQALGAEFARVTPPAATAWLPVRLAHVLLLVLGALLIGYCGARLQDGRMGLLLASHVVAVTLGYTATFIVGGLAVCYVAVRARQGLTPEQTQGLARAALLLTGLALLLTATGVLLGGFWARDHLGRFWGWDMKETGGAVVLAWNVALLVFVGGRPAATHTALLLPFLGNIVVSAAWFGPFAFRPIAPTAAAALIAFAVVQIGLLALGLVPAGSLRQRAA